MSDRLRGRDLDEPIISEPKTLEETTIDRRRRANQTYQRGRGPGTTAVGPRKGDEKKLPPARPYLLLF